MNDEQVRHLAKKYPPPWKSCVRNNFRYPGGVYDATGEELEILENAALAEDVVADFNAACERLGLLLKKTLTQKFVERYKLPLRRRDELLLDADDQILGFSNCSDDMDFHLAAIHEKAARDGVDFPGAEKLRGVDEEAPSPDGV